MMNERRFRTVRDVGAGVYAIRHPNSTLLQSGAFPGLYKYRQEVDLETRISPILRR